MELNAVTRSVGDIFSLNKRYLVPRFQREYSWGPEEVDEFWDDITQQVKISRKGVPTNEEYFIGCIVLVGEDSKRDYLIVDGQQRLTTLTILLRAIVARLQALGDDAAAKALYENVIEGTDNDGKEYFKLVNESPKPYFQNELQSFTPEGLKIAETEEEILLQSAYTSFTKSLKNLKFGTQSPLDSVKTLRTEVLSYLKFILVTAKSEDDAYTIFETLNARGLSLTSVDLIKNWIFKNYSKTHPNDNAKEIWGEIRRSISDFSNLETFFRHYWNSKYSFSSDDRLYKSFNDFRKTGKIKPARDFLLEIKEASRRYRMIGAPAAADWPLLKEKVVGRSLNLINQHKVTQVRPFLLALIECRKNKVVDETAFVKTIINLENFHFVFSRLCQDRASGLEGKYTRAAKNLHLAGSNKIKAKQVLKDLYEYLLSKRPKPDRIVAAVSDLKFDKNFDGHKKTIQLVFSKIEQHLQRTNELLVGDFSLEHIRDQSSKDSDVARIGNLIPLDESLNNKIKQGSTFKEKKLVYKKSSFKLTKDLVATFTKDDWTKTQIRTWETEIGNLLCQASELKKI